MARRPRLVFQDNALLDPATQATLLDKIKSVGGTGVQQDVHWGDVRKNGQYDWSKLTALVDAANARGIRPQFRLMGSNSSMQKTDPLTDMALNTAHPDAGLMGRFARDTATAFGGKVGKYSIWNEPNIGTGRSSWGNPKQAARTYRELYQAGYAGVKAANPNAKVGFGELVATDPGERGPMTELGFLRQVLALGNKPLRADYVSVHPYQPGNPGPSVDPKLRPVNPDYGGINYLGDAQNAISRAFAGGRLRTATGKRPDLTIGEFGYQHSWVPNAHRRAQYLAAAVREAQHAGVASMNLYQLMPTNNAASGWDSSILNQQGQIDPTLGAALKRMRRGA